MAMQSENRSFSPLMIGAIAVIAVLVLFLLFAGGTGTQQAGIDTVPPATTKSSAPATPPATAPKTTPPAGSGAQ
jgi:hypothetical protein